MTLARCRAAAAMITLPTAGLPVKKMWSTGKSSNTSASLSSSSKAETRRSSNTAWTTSRMTRAVAGVKELGFTIAVLPAASAATVGSNNR